jgi:hypothetical protein
MDPTTVFVKTARGQEEITSRTRQLAPRLRLLLIMIDGNRTAGELLSQNPDKTGTELTALLEGGYIAVRPEEAVAPPAAPVVDVRVLRNTIRTMLHDIMGPEADMFTVKLEAAKSGPELLQQAEKMREVIRTMIGNKKAEQFWQKITALLTS